MDAEARSGTAGSPRPVVKRGGVIRSAYMRMANLRVSTTDPGASPMNQEEKGASGWGTSRTAWSTVARRA